MKARHVFGLLVAAAGLFLSNAKAQSVLFDFDTTPLHAPLPIDLTIGGITAHFSANPAYYNYSIQRADTMGFTPLGFAGNCIYPSTIYPCDLLISFDRQLTDISILYAPDELATDSSCTMRITAFSGTTQVATTTYTNPNPGTWPSATLSLSSSQPFDNVVIHYEAPPITGGDYGTIFMVDNLQVLPVNPPQLINISTRLQVLNGDNVLIGGFIIAGPTNKPVLLRALGPTLGQFGVPGSLQDPMLELHDSVGALIDSNDNWKDTQQAAIAATNLAPPNYNESAILISLAPGNYTAIVRGKNNSTGVALVESYDMDQTVASTVTNISTRGFVGTGDNVMIGGFISANTDIRIIIRALGPTLSQFGVPNVLPDPILRLHDTNGTLIASNDNWADTQHAEIQASGKAPPNSAESAIIAVRPAGNSTAIVSGKNNTTGNALVEVYTLPP